jgi:hypothetical protein
MKGSDAHRRDDEFLERSFHFHIDCGADEKFRGAPGREFEVFLWLEGMLYEYQVTYILEPRSMPSDLSRMSPIDSTAAAQK